MPEPQTIVVKRHDVAKEQLLKTPSGEPNILIQPISAIRMILTRTARVYVQSLVGMLGVTGTGIGFSEEIQQMLPTEYGALLWLSMRLSIAPAIVTFFQNVLEWLKALEGKK